MSEQRMGEVYILLQAFLWGFYPIVAILSFANIGPLFSLAATTFFALIFFTLVISYRGKWSEMKEVEGVKDALMSSLFLGVLFFGLQFYGLQYTTAGNASLIALLIIFTTFLFFNVVRKEHITRNQIIGALLMVVGAVTIVLPDLIGNLSLNKGDLFIFLAVFMPPFGNFYQQRARKKISGETIMFIRMLVTVPIVFALAILLGEVISFSELGKSVWYIALSGFFVFGLSKIWWLEGIHRMSVTKAQALAATTPLFTLLFAFLILNEVPTVFQLLAFIPLALGVILLTRDKAEAVAIDKGE